jgi:hypothetical protein
MLTSKEQQTLLIRQDHYQKSPTVGQKKKKSRNYYLTKQKVSGYQIEHLSDHQSIYQTILISQKKSRNYCSEK